MDILLSVLMIFMLFVKAVRASGGKVTHESGPVKGGTTVIAFVEDQMAINLNLSKIKKFKIWSRQLIKRCGWIFSFFYNAGLPALFIKRIQYVQLSRIPYHHQLKIVFVGYFPVIIDVETAGFDAKRCTLELAAITLKWMRMAILQP